METISAAASLHGDSLLFALPDPVRGDSVHVHFTTHLLCNATLFALDLGSSAHPGRWPAARRANIVMRRPELTSSTALTPNGDGINAQLTGRAKSKAASRV